MIRRPPIRAADRPYHYDMPAVAHGFGELAVQKDCLKMIARLFPECRAAAVPNAGKRTKWAAGRAKAEGLATGFPDIVITGPGRLVAFPEIKGASGSVRPEQHLWLCDLVEQGHYCGVFRSSETLEAAMIKWGFPSVLRKGL